MLFKNDIFVLDGVQMRLLHADPIGNLANCISLDSGIAWPMGLPYIDVCDLESVPMIDTNHRTHSESCLSKCAEAWARLEPLILKHGNNLFDPRMRNMVVIEHAQELKCSPVTLRSDLRRYWQRGQNKLALMPDFAKSGRVQQPNEIGLMPITAGRGRKPFAGHSTFQMTSQDASQMKSIIESGYLKDERITAVDAYAELVTKHYRYEDGNQQRFVNPLGELPSLQQFRHFLFQNYDIETRLRGRAGHSDFEREHRKVLGTVLADCLGVGHYYEIDATICDVYLVSREDPNKIIGKPTLYLIIDRKSRLIVGFYFGLENASWNAALQAILSISEDKRKLCAHYGVAYDRSDWPADRVFPQEFLADRGDMISHASSNIVEGLQVTVTNLPSKRPDWKPLVECGFKLIHQGLRPLTPAYDPPSNATKRRGKNYSKDACLTIPDFGNLFLNTIIQYNRRQILKYELSPAELLAGVRPSPIELWNHGIASRAGVLTRFTEEKVRFSLLRKDTAVVTEHGVEFRGCFYSFPEAISQKWFETARKRRFNTVVSFDPRMVDQIYVHSLDGKQEPYVAALTLRSLSYSGLSFEEVRFYEILRRAVRDQAGHERLQNTVDLRAMTEPGIAQAKARLKSAGIKKSRTARRADTKPARAEERAIERKEQATLQAVPLQALAVTNLLERPESTPVQTTTTMQERLAAARARMKA